MVSAELHRAVGEAMVESRRVHPVWELAYVKVPWAVQEVALVVEVKLCQMARYYIGCSHCAAREAANVRGDAGMVLLLYCLEAEAALHHHF